MAVLCKEKRERGYAPRKSCAGLQRFFQQLAYCGVYLTPAESYRQTPNVQHSVVLRRRELYLKTFLRRDLPEGLVEVGNFCQLGMSLGAQRVLVFIDETRIAGKSQQHPPPLQGNCRGAIERSCNYKNNFR